MRSWRKFFMKQEFYNRQSETKEERIAKYPENHLEELKYYARNDIHRYSKTK